MPIEELNAEDQIEIQYYRDYNNKVYDSMVYKDRGMCSNGISKDIHDTLFFSDDPNISELYDFAQINQFKPVKARYVRYSCNSSNINTFNTWRHVKVFNKEMQNLAWMKDCYYITGTKMSDSYCQRLTGEDITEPGNDIISND